MKLLLVVVTVTLAIVLYTFWTPDESGPALERKYAQPGVSYLVVQGIRLRVRDTGPRQAQVLMLLHGFGSSLETWDAWTATLEGRYRVISLDLPGAGLTGPDPTDNYSDARTLLVIGSLMDRLSVPHAVIIGNSMGGRLGWKFAALFPERVDKLVLVSPDGFASPGFAYGKPPRVPFFSQLIRFSLPRFLLRMDLAVAYANPALLTDERVQRYYDMLLAPGVRAAILARLQQTVLENPKPFLLRIRAPTLLLWGQRDAMIPVANASDYVGLIPRCELHTLPDLGHVPQEEDPVRSVTALVEFLSRT